MQQTRPDTARIRAARRVIDPVFLDIPLYRCEAPEPHLGCAVSIKLEFDLLTIGVIHIMAPKGTPVFAGDSPGQIARQISGHQHGSPAVPSSGTPPAEGPPPARGRDTGAMQPPVRLPPAAPGSIRTSPAHVAGALGQMLRQHGIDQGLHRCLRRLRRHLRQPRPGGMDERAYVAVAPQLLT